ncbi:MAG: PLP-dependent aminotransferase family protein [Desulfovibrionaceae bacterium]
MKLQKLYDESSADTKYMGIMHAIEQGIEQGILTAGEALPTQRELAEALQVTVGTVSRGYAEAVQRGLIVGVTGRGTFVAARRDDVDVLRASGTTAYNLGYISPFEFLNPSLNESLARLSRQESLEYLTNYQEPRGLLRHRQAGALWAQRYGVHVDADNLLICAGAQHALLTVLTSLFNPGDRIAAEHLTYPLLKQLAKRLCLHLVPLRMDGSGIVPESFEAACRAGGIKGLYLMPSCQNPTLAHIPDFRRHALVALCRRYDVTIIEDDVYALALESTTEKSSPPFVRLAPERTCFIAATSEALSGGLRIAYLCPPEAHAAELERTISYTISMAPPLMAELAALWIQDGTADRILAAKKQEAAARNVLARTLLDGFALETRTTGFFAWLKLPSPWTSATFTDAACKQGVLVAEGDHFAIGHAGTEAGVRLALGGLKSRVDLSNALLILANILHQTRK